MPSTANSTSLQQHLKRHAEAARKAAEISQQKKAVEYRVLIERMKKAETWLQLVAGPELDRAAKALSGVDYTAVVAAEDKEQLQHTVSVVGTESWVQDTFLSDLSLKFSTTPGGPLDCYFTVKLDKKTLSVAMERGTTGSPPESVSAAQPFEQVDRQTLENLITAAVIAATPVA